MKASALVFNPHGGLRRRAVLKKMPCVTPAGFEPATPALGDPYSKPLSETDAECGTPAHRLMRLQTLRWRSVDRRSSDVPSVQSEVIRDRPGRNLIAAEPSADSRGGPHRWESTGVCGRRGLRLRH